MDIFNIVQWFEKAVPSPSPKNQAVQIGCHFEEVNEMLRALGMRDVFLENAPAAFKQAKTLGSIAQRPIDKTELLDSLCDQIVTAIGVGHMMGFDILGALAEVNRSNWSKFENGNPIFDENGKIKKGADYFPPDLTKYIEVGNEPK